MLICKNDKIVIPKIIQEYIVNWYHTYLLYLGQERTEVTISEHYYWPNSRDDTQTHIKVCNACHKTRKNFKYGKLPTNKSEVTPWDRLLEDFIGSYKFEEKFMTTPSY